MPRPGFVSPCSRPRVFCPHGERTVAGSESPGKQLYFITVEKAHSLPRCPAPCSTSGNCALHDRRIRCFDVRRRRASPAREREPSFSRQGGRAAVLLPRRHRVGVVPSPEPRRSDALPGKPRTKGFTVIQAVALAELDGLDDPNPYGYLPLIDNDPARPAVREGPDNDYWDHVDFIVAKAEQLGLFIGFLPTWGDKWNKKRGNGAGDLHAAECRDLRRVAGPPIPRQADHLDPRGRSPRGNRQPKRRSCEPWPGVCGGATLEST